MVILRKRIAGLSPSTLERFLRRARRAARVSGTVNVLVTNNRELRSLNSRFRGKDKPTDVLSFPAPLDHPQAKKMVGDLAISADLARDNAKRQGHSLPAEIKILVLHGVLHLAGFDHERDHGEMAHEESRLQSQLKLNGGLIERTQRAIQPLSRDGRRNSPAAKRRIA